jgi:two-component system, OmpR family, phosphate regulon response regulator PhoB
MAAMSTSILVVEDEPAIQELLRLNLEDAGFTVHTVADAESAQAQINAALPDLILLDWMLPGQSGLAFARTLRSDARTRELPIIMVTARSDEADRISGLEAWVDDYVTKPFSPRELVARVRAVLRRGGGEEVADLLLLGELEIDVPAREVRLRGSDVRLAAREFDLLAFLARHPRRVFTREQIMQSVWGYTAAIDTGTLSVHVRRLREKIEDDPRTPRRIETVWNVGYRFVA